MNYYYVDFRYQHHLNCGPVLSHSLIVKAKDDEDAIRNLKKDYAITRIWGIVKSSEDMFLQQESNSKNQERWKKILEEKA